ncbi:hypothetical protein VFPBJ_08128 [Purpureocillium lilacinum]|uniref:Uncharacterized protein n=1 Tax=Purpureocillium lilacinum TaxID=33203 RepID=A0A179GIF8_PURLI|nr:hypothetical protein VFPBJ_08128 [Purpureocillium lilacinum]
MIACTGSPRDTLSCLEFPLSHRLGVAAHEGPSTWVGPRSSPVRPAPSGASYFSASRTTYSYVASLRPVCWA